MSAKINYVISINVFFLLLSYDLQTLKLVITKRLAVNEKFPCGVLGPIKFWSGNVMNYVEVVLKITDNGAAVKKGYIVYLATYLLPVNNNLPLHLFWSKLQYYYIMISE